MPPRVCSPSLPLAQAIVDGALERTRPSAPRAAASCARAFSTTPCCNKMSKARQQMFQWLKGREGSEFAAGGRGPKYLGPFLDQPFPLNPLFRSQPVLDDMTKELIWEKVMKRGDSLFAVSAEIGVDVRRVAAVVRMKKVEKQWVEQGKKLATPYAKAVMSMLPKTGYREGERNPPHEPVNEVHVHKLTMQQLFVPVSESRHFTREDAAKAFHEYIKSADERSPQPHLIQMEKDVLAGMPRKESRQKFVKAVEAQEDAVARKLAEQQRLEEDATTRVRTDRYEFRFKDFNSEDVGPTGRSRRAVGWRYGAPLQDRKRGIIKIPTSVP